MRSLTRRQLQFVYLLCTEGLYYREIAERLHLKEGTVKYTLKQVHDAIGTDSAVTLVIRFYNDEVLRNKAIAAAQELQMRKVS
jgi:DNA-binding NarL/FixJ family response regulator